jgi:hypothetical protein
MCLSETAWLVTLYVLGFALQIAGVVLVVIEITEDVRAAQAIKERADAPDASPQGVVGSAPGVEMYVGGLAGAFMAQTAQNVDSFRTFTAERLSGGLRRRVLGVALIILGAIAGFAANLIAVL